MTAVRRCRQDMGGGLAMRVVVITTIALAAICPAARADRYSREVLFSLDYGSGPRQLGISVPEPDEEAEKGPPRGPTDVAVGRNGGVYMADEVNRRVLGFDQYGNLIMVTKERVDSPQLIAADSKGNVYMLEASGPDFLSKFGPDGARLWGIALPALIPVGLHGPASPVFWELSVGSDDTLCVGFDQGAGLAVAVLNGDGALVSTHQAYARTPANRFVSLENLGEEKLASAIRIVGADGATTASYTADVGSSCTLSIMAGAVDFTRRFFDVEDGCYNLLHAVRAQRVPLRANLDLALDVIVTRHDRTGRLTAYLRVPASPFPSGLGITVDPQGNVYHLAYGPSSVTVVRYRLHKSEEVGETWELAPEAAGK